MLSFALAASLVSFVIPCIPCFISCCSCCGDDDRDRAHGRSQTHRAPSHYGSITVQPLPQSLPSPTYTPDSYVRAKSKAEPPTASDHDRGSYSHGSHVSTHAEPSCLAPSHEGLVALTSTSSPSDPHLPTRSEATGNRDAPSSSLTNLEPEGENIRKIAIPEDLRERARRQKREMEKALKLANGARKKGDRDARVRYNRQARAHKGAMKRLNEAAARAIFEKKNKGRRTTGTVDLHGLYVTEALGYAKRELELATQRADRAVRFIVGKGLHTEGGKAKIRPALEKFCDERGLTHVVHPRNTGVLVVRC